MWFIFHILSSEINSVISSGHVDCNCACWLISCMLSGRTGWLATVREWWCGECLRCQSSDWWMFWHNRGESELVTARIEFHHVAFFSLYIHSSLLWEAAVRFFFFFYQENVALLTDLVTSCYSDCHSSFPPRAVKTTQFQICWKNTNKHMMIWQNMRPIELIRNQGDRFLLCEMSPQSHNNHMISQSSCVSFPQSLVTLQSRLKKVSQSPFHDQYKVSVYTDTS